MMSSLEKISLLIQMLYIFVFFFFFVSILHSVLGDNCLIFDIANETFQIVLT